MTVAIRAPALVPLLLVALFDASNATAQDIYPRPPAARIVLPATGSGWLSPDEERGDCEAENPAPWSLGATREIQFFVSAELLGGSGHIWHLQVGEYETVGVEKIAKRFLCIDTSTLGWRTLRNFEDKPLPWVADIDGDGNDELLLWSSYSLNRSELDHFGLIAWVYSSASGDVLALDVELTKQMTKRVADAYRRELENLTETQQRERNNIADALTEYLPQIAASHD